MKNKNNLKITIFILSIFFSFGRLLAQQELQMSLKFTEEDSIKVCKVYVTSEDSVVKDVEVNLFVKRLYSLLPIGDATATDEEGIATFAFPVDLPVDLNGKLLVIAKIEESENYAEAEIKEEVNLGVAREIPSIMERSLAGSREKAPYYLMIVSNLIIIGIWGTLIYVILQVIRMKKAN